MYSRHPAWQEQFLEVLIDVPCRHRFATDPGTGHLKTRQVVFILNWVARGTQLSRLLASRLVASLGPRVQTSYIEAFALIKMSCLTRVNNLECKMEMFGLLKDSLWTWTCLNYLHLRFFQTVITIFSIAAVKIFRLHIYYLITA